MSCSRGPTNKQQQLNPLVQPLKVVQDVSTRWNSTYYMLQRLVKLRVPLTAVLCDDQLTPKRQDREMLLKDNEWMLAEHLIELLEPFEMATTAVSGQRYVTLSLLLPVASHLYLEVSSTLEKQLPTAAKNVAAKLMSEMTRKFPEISTPSPSSLPVVAAALDPLFRHLNFLDSDKAEAVKEEVLDRVEKQFGTTATTNLLEPPAKRAAPTGSLSRLFKSRATEPGEPAGTYPACLDREVEVYFKEAEVDIEGDPLPCGRLTKLGFPMWPHLLGKYSACQEHLFHLSVCSPQLAFSSRNLGVLCRLSTLTLPSSLVATRCCQAPGSARRLLQDLQER